MDSKPSKQLVKSAAVLSLTAVLAAMPVSASYRLVVTPTSASAEATGTNAQVYAELSCEYGGVSDSDSISGYGDVSASVDSAVAEAYHRGEIRASYAYAWTDEELGKSAIYPN